MQCNDFNIVCNPHGFFSFFHFVNRAWNIQIKVSSFLRKKKKERKWFLFKETFFYELYRELHFNNLALKGRHFWWWKIEWLSFKGCSIFGVTRESFFFLRFHVFSGELKIGKDIKNTHKHTHKHTHTHLQVKKKNWSS